MPSPVAYALMTHVPALSNDTVDPLVDPLIEHTDEDPDAMETLYVLVLAPLRNTV